MEKYQTNFASPDGIQMAMAMLEQWDPNRVFYAISINRRVKTSDVIALDGKVLVACGLFENEYANLVKLAQTFNEQFVTKDNKRFDTAQKLFNKARSSIATFKKCFKVITPDHSTSKNLNSLTPQPYIYHRSSLGTAEVGPILFNETYPPEVQSLAEHIHTLFNLIQSALTLCTDVLAVENEIRQDASRCQELYRIFKDEIVSYNGRVLKDINIHTQAFDPHYNPAIDLRNSCNSEADFAQKGFHILDFTDTSTLVIKEKAEEAQREGLTDDEFKLFKKDISAAKKVRYIIENFDVYLPSTYHGKTIPAKYIACLMQLCQPSIDKLFVAYFKKTYTNAGGTHIVTANSSVNGKKHKERQKDPDFNQIYEAWDSYKED